MLMFSLRRLGSAALGASLLACSIISANAWSPPGYPRFLERIVCDDNRDGQVMVNEVIRCAAALLDDGSVTVAEIVRAVGASLDR